MSSESGGGSSEDDILWYDYEDSMREHKVTLGKGNDLYLNLGLVEGKKFEEDSTEE